MPKRILRGINSAVSCKGLLCNTSVFPYSAITTKRPAMRMNGIRFVRMVFGFCDDSILLKRKKIAGSRTIVTLEKRPAVKKRILRNNNRLSEDRSQ